ncbi:MAG: guanylate kinase [Parachlamydiaceae bacterium]|nr:guanylate kinase [Parachlamydiaceae bacterium]
MKLLGNLKQGLVFILSAPAGTGKTTLVQKLVTEFPVVVANVSYTTRAPRTGEINGSHYHFVTEADFLARIAKGEFLEYVQLYGDYYGTSQLWLEEQLAHGKHVFLVIDTQGAKLLKEKINAIHIFVSPPSLEVLEKRLQSRKTEPESVIQKRLDWAKQEMLAKNAYDYLIINDDLDTAYQVLRSIVIAEEHRIG